MRNLMLILVAVVAACSDNPKPVVDAPPAADAAIDTPTVALDCPTYCTQIMTNCKDANAQYLDMAHCLGACATIPVGTSKVTDTTGNTLGCRIYHSGAPSASDPALHCAHGGPAGDKLNVATPGFCSGGDLCATFCAEQIKTCGSTDTPVTVGGTAINAQYKNQAACVAVCKNGDATQNPAILAFDTTHLYGPTSAGASLACRLNHWTNAATASAAGSAQNTQTHCNHSAPQPTAPCIGAATP